MNSLKTLSGLALMVFFSSFSNLSSISNAKKTVKTTDPYLMSLLLGVRVNTTKNLYVDMKKVLQQFKAEKERLNQKTKDLAEQIFFLDKKIRTHVSEASQLTNKKNEKIL